MFRMACIAASAALLLSVDVPQIVRSQAATPTRNEIPSAHSLPIFPSDPETSVDSASIASATSAPQPTVDHPSASQQNESKPSGSLKEESRMQILRFVDG